MSKLTTKKMVYISLFVTLNIVFTRFLSFQTPIVRFDLGFLPIAMAGMVLGPLWGGVAGVMGDILGMLINSKGMAYFFPYTINAFLYGFTYGLFLYKKDIGLKRIITLVLLQIIVINIGLSSLWSFLFVKYVMGNEKSFYLIFTSRCYMALVLTPVHIIGVNIIAKFKRIAM